MSGVVFGSSEEVRGLGIYIKKQVRTLDEQNDVVKAYISQLSGTARDKSLDEAQGIVSEVSRIISGCMEPMEAVAQALNEYAELLQSME